MNELMNEIPLLRCTLEGFLKVCQMKVPEIRWSWGVGWGRQRRRVVHLF